MKYISRITALLLVLVMLTPTFASALTLGTATQGDLDKLYQEASEDTVIYGIPGLLGDWSELSAFGNLAAKDLYSFQWINEDGEILPCFNDPWVVRVANTMEEQKFYCVATDATGNELVSPVYVVPAADISDPNLYVNWIWDTAYFTDTFGAADTLTIYQALTVTWNVLRDDGSNLAEEIVKQWWSDREETYFDPYLLCSCVVSGAVAADECVLHPNSDLHVNGCSWKQPEIAANVDVSTPESLLTLTSVVLAAEERADVDSYAWQNYVYDPATAGMRWAILNYVQDTNLYTVQINKESIQTAYRVVIETTDYNVFESKPFYLGGYDFFNWILTNEDIQVWMADDSVTLADVVARYNNAADEEDRTNAEDYTYGEEGESVNLKVPQGTFAEDYVMEIAQVAAERVAQLQNAVMDQLDATGTHVAQVLMALDISFASLANRANKLQPNAPVALTFEVDTTGIDAALKYLYVYHIANDGTPEVVAGPIDAAFGVQKIVVQADGFSEYVVLLSSDSCAYCSGYCVYEELIADMPASEMFELLDDMEAEAREVYLNAYYLHIAAGEPEVLCNCMDLLTNLTDVGAKHDLDCPWHSYNHVHTDVVGWAVTLMAPASVTDYVWTDENGNEIARDESILEVLVKSKPHTYYCNVEENGEPVTYTYYVEAQTTVLSSYLNVLLTYFEKYEELKDYVEFVYNLMSSTDADDELHWNFDVCDEKGVYLYNMAEAVLSYWMQVDGLDLLCSCCVDEDGNVTPTADGKIMFSWDEEHDENCPWHIQGYLAIELEPITDGEGNVVSYELVAYTDGFSKVVIATSTLMKKDENSNAYHYFQDVNTGWYVAYLHVDEEGNEWIIPLPSEKDLEETPAN